MVEKGFELKIQIRLNFTPFRFIVKNPLVSLCLCVPLMYTLVNMKAVYVLEHINKYSISIKYILFLTSITLFVIIFRYVL